MVVRSVAPGPKATKLRPIAPAKLGRLVLLDHDNGGKPLGSLQAAIGLTSRADGTPVADKPLQDLIDAAVAAKPDTVGLASFAVIDLTTKGAVRYAGHRATVPFHPASMGKLAIMLGAYQLRHDLRKLVADDAGKTIKDLPTLAAAAAKRWVTAQKGVTTIELKPPQPGWAPAAGDHVVSHGGKPVTIAAPFDRVMLDRVFDAKKGLALEWRSDGLGFHQLMYIDLWQKKVNRPQLQKIFKAHLGLTAGQLIERGAGFEDRMKLMVGLSTNNAPSALAADISQALIHSTLLRAGLFDPRAGGLWLGHPYASGNVFLDPPVQGEKIEFEKGKPTRPHATGTALACATLLAALFKDAVVDATACAEMRGLLQKTRNSTPASSLKDDPAAWHGVNIGSGTRSPVQDALRGDDKTRRGWNDDTKTLAIHSKLGLITDYELDAAHVRHVTDGGEINYVLAVFDVTYATYDRMTDTVKAVDHAVAAVNKVKRKPITP